MVRSRSRPRLRSPGTLIPLLASEAEFHSEDRPCQGSLRLTYRREDIKMIPPLPLAAVQTVEDDAH